MDKEKNLQYWIDHWQAEEHQRRSHEELWDNRADFFNEKVFSLCIPCADLLFSEPVHMHRVFQRALLCLRIFITISQGNNGNQLEIPGDTQQIPYLPLHS